MRKQGIFAAVLLGVAALGAPTTASAVQVQCATETTMVTLLTKRFSEAPVAMGTVNEDRYMQLFVSSEGSWTILVTKTDGQACIVAAGNNWEQLPMIKAEQTF